MYLLIDNYDSFTYILKDYLLQLNMECHVYKNDEITVDEIKRMAPSRIIISPGPATPMESGICMEVIDQFHKTTPILGICLGHQALGMYFGAKLVHAAYPMHGKTSPVSHSGHPVFENVDSPFEAMRYHSLAIDEPPAGLNIIATAQDDGCVMAITHGIYPCVGIQFHPESIGTKEGFNILKNWRDLYNKDGLL